MNVIAFRKKGADENVWTKTRTRRAGDGRIPRTGDERTGHGADARTGHEKARHGADARTGHEKARHGWPPWTGYGRWPLGPSSAPTQKRRLRMLPDAVSFRIGNRSGGCSHHFLKKV